MLLGIIGILNDSLQVPQDLAFRQKRSVLFIQCVKPICNRVQLAELEIERNTYKIDHVLTQQYVWSLHERPFYILARKDEVSKGRKTLD